jgi:regulator of cell morphogenesis and NO signaling
MTTTTTTKDATVGQIAAETPASVRVFERYGIDYCCGGRVAFDEACRGRGVEPEKVLAEIEGETAAPEDTTDWTTAPVDELIDHIVEKHHVYLKTNLPRIAEKIAKVVAAHGEKVPAIAGVFRAMHEELDAHMMKEEMILFPMIRTTGRGAMGPIRVMLAEHDSAGDALAALRSLTGGYVAPEGACNTWRSLYFELAELERDLHRHIHLENNVLFPRVLG